jgi:hypothetical protein
MNNENMKKILFPLLVALLVLLTCTKREFVAPPEKKQTCDFGINLEETKSVAKRPTGNPPKGGGARGLPVILIDFDGHLVKNTAWNYAGDINCNSSGLTDEQMVEVLEKVKVDYAPWVVNVTTSDSIYNAAPTNRRTRVVLTTSYEWFGSMAGGVAYIGSFTWTDETPCFVFTSLLGYNTKYIKEATSHEAGHTLGLYHQSVCNNGILMVEYNRGGGGTAPIMGNSYYEPLGLFITGTNNSCEIQCDQCEIGRILKLR